MPMIETTSIRRTPAASPASWRFRLAVVKNAVASASSGDGPVAASMMQSTPVRARSRPTAVMTSRPWFREIGTTPCPRSSRTSTTWRPSRPVAPATAINMGVLLCRVTPDNFASS
jgi:hypothetical protein